jgi:hypothetical protein
MALLFCDGFDAYTQASDLMGKGWISGNSLSSLDALINWNAAGGVYGGGGVAIGPSHNYTVMMVLTVAFTMGATFNSALMFRQAAPPVDSPAYSSNYGGLMNMGYGNIGPSYTNSIFAVNNSGFIQFTGFGMLTPLGPPGVHNVCDGQWHWIEMQVVLTTATTGSAMVYVDGELDLVVTGVRTIYNSFVLPNGTVGFGAVNNSSSGYVTSYFDDFIVWDNTGSSFNTFPIGQKRIYTGKPTGAGASAQFTPSAGSNYAIAAQGYSGSGTLTATVPGKLDMYTTSILNGTNPVDIDAVVVNTFSKNAGNGGAVFLAPMLRDNGVLRAAPTVQPTATATNFRSTFLLDSAGNPWTKAAIDALQFGMESMNGY